MDYVVSLHVNSNGSKEFFIIDALSNAVVSVPDLERYAIVVDYATEEDCYGYFYTTDIDRALDTVNFLNGIDELAVEINYALGTYLN